MASPQTGHIAAQAQGAKTYTNVFRAELSGAGRMAGTRPDFSQMVRQSGAVQTAAVARTGAAGQDGGFIAFIKGVIDVINPLQHIPVIGTIYRHITGDEIGPVARVAGGALFGGPIGAAVGVVNAAVAGTTGKDVGGNMIAMVGGGKNAPAAPAKPPAETQGTLLAAADIVWHTPAPGVEAARTGQQIEQHIRESRAAQLAALDSQTFPSSDTPTPLRTRTGGNTGPDGGSLPSATPALQAKKGMLAPTQTADRTHTGQAAGAGRSTAPDVGNRNPATHPAEASPVLQSQDAPAAVVARKATPPEQIASLSAADGSLGIVAPAADNRLVPQQMMAALDKYAALKKSQHATAATGRLVPSLH